MAEWEFRGVVTAHDANQKQHRLQKFVLPNDTTSMLSSELRESEDGATRYILDDQSIAIINKYARDSLIVEATGLQLWLD